MKILKGSRLHRLGPCILLAAGLLVFTGGGNAWAHAFPDHSDPRVGSTVDSPPAIVRIWFDGALEPAFCTISVTNSSGARVDKGTGRVSPEDPNLLEAAVPRLSSGTYRVIWNVVARDGHRTTGDYSFSIK
ncbi:MAG: copper resistance protein CopC [Nitrospiraceae bacterium]|nr:copper resistance protein CopC [Nitrospiraceae bacterium]